MHLSLYLPSKKQTLRQVLETETLKPSALVLDTAITRTFYKITQTYRNYSVCGLKHLAEGVFTRGQKVEIMSKYKYLGSIVNKKLNCKADNTETIGKEGQQRVYLLRKLKSFLLMS